MKLIYLSALAFGLLAGCTNTGAAVETRYKTITITKRGPCPAPAVYAKLKASRPTPLRQQAKPKTAVERSARSQAQLGLYEAEGKWADNVTAALERCQVPTEEKSESEGVATGP